jgi:hypothetical protein
MPSMASLANGTVMFTVDKQKYVHGVVADFWMERSEGTI